jgi:hypothetical protein
MSEMIGSAQHSTTDENNYNSHYNNHLNDDVDDDHQSHDSFHGGGTSWQEGMDSICDIIHPDVTSPQKGEKLPTLLLPWRGGNGFGSRNNNNNNNKMNGRGNGGGCGGAGSGATTNCSNGLSRLTSTPFSRNHRGLNGRE